MTFSFHSLLNLRQIAWVIALHLFAEGLAILSTFGFIDGGIVF